MKEIALQVTRDQTKNKLNTLREYLQNYLLFLIQRSKLGSEIYFVGGTALRFLFKIGRYSEDLDFSAGLNWKPSRLNHYLKKIETALLKSGYRLGIRTTEQANIQKVRFGFLDLLSETGLSNRSGHKISIHLELDSNPPMGWNSEKTMINLHFPVMLSHYDLPSLFAGKIHAVLTREYTKGRDLFDLLWYRSKWRDLVPNFILLNNALNQTQKNYQLVAENNWLELIYQKINPLSWQMIVEDVKPFIEHETDSYSFTKSNLLSLYKRTQYLKSKRDQ